MTQPATPKDQPTPCGHDCDSCREAETCEALLPVLAQLSVEADPAETRQAEGATWK